MTWLQYGSGGREGAMSPPATFQLLAPSPPFFPSSTQPTLHRPPSKAVTAVNRSAAQEEKQGSGRGFAEEHSQHDCRLTLFLGEPPPSPSLPCNLISRSSSLLWRQKAPSSSPLLFLLLLPPTQTRVLKTFPIL